MRVKSATDAWSQDEKAARRTGFLQIPEKKKKLPSTRITFVSTPVLITTGVPINDNQQHFFRCQIFTLENRV
jgi:hypothetical protein